MAFPHKTGLPQFVPAGCPQLHRDLPRAARHQTLGGRVARPSGPSCGFVDSHDLVPTPVSRAGGHTRRLRRPTAGASHAPSGAVSPLCRGRGLFAQEARSGVGRPCLLPAVPRCGARGGFRYKTTGNAITKPIVPICSWRKDEIRNTEIYRAILFRLFVQKRPKNTHFWQFSALFFLLYLSVCTNLYLLRGNRPKQQNAPAGATNTKPGLA
jgi:hypothetical protein